MDITITATDLATMSHDDVARALGFVAKATAATVASPKRRGTVSSQAPTESTDAGIVLISAENNPLA
jgi:hypothetical protein